MFGGVLTSAFNWRAIFWFLTVASGLNLLAFVLFFRDTFRRERSLTYQNVIKQRRKAAALASLSDTQPETSLAVDLDLTLADVNPLKPLGQVVRRENNVLVLIASGNYFYPADFLYMNALTTLCIAYQYSFLNLMAYASSRTLGTAYGYSPMNIGFVILSLGVGKFFLFSKLVQTGWSVLGGGVQDPSPVVYVVAAGLIMSLDTWKPPITANFIQRWVYIGPDINTSLTCFHVF